MILQKNWVFYKAHAAAQMSTEPGLDVGSYAIMDSCPLKYGQTHSSWLPDLSPIIKHLSLFKFYNTLMYMTRKYDLFTSKCLYCHISYTYACPVFLRRPPPAPPYLFFAGSQGQGFIEEKIKWMYSQFMPFHKKNSLSKG